MAKNEKAYRDRKTLQLGEDIALAHYKLKRIVYLMLIQKAGMDTCFQCGEKITDVNDISIEHKEPYIGSFDPQIMFYLPSNIAFSHKKCNTAARRTDLKKAKHPSNYTYNQGCRCQECLDARKEYYRLKRLYSKI